MEFRILGPVQIRDHGKEDALGGTKQRTMFAALLLAGGRAVSDDHLSRMLWDDAPPCTAQAQVHTYASRIRRCVGPAVPVLRISTGYRMPAQHVPCDHTDFHRLAQEGLQALRRRDHERASALLAAALRLWRGDALADVTSYLIDAERSQLDESRLEILEGWLEAQLELGRHRQIIPELTGLVAHHPLRERFRALLMTALYRAERQADAMSVYRSGRRILADQLGVEPGLLLVKTYQAVLTGEVRTQMPHELAS